MAPLEVVLAVWVRQGRVQTEPQDKVLAREAGVEAVLYPQAAAESEGVVLSVLFPVHQSPMQEEEAQEEVLGMGRGAQAGEEQAQHRLGEGLAAHQTLVAAAVERTHGMMEPLVGQVVLVAPA
jgi:hypothetical protein